MSNLYCKINLRIEEVSKRMKTLKNKDGFTLIELLAVIVVLAIVIVLATTTMLPLMNRALKKSFVDEANAARATATDIMSLILIDSFDIPVKGVDYQESDKKVCISLKEMARQGLFDKDMENFEKDGENPPEYEGKVIITKGAVTDSANNYQYQVIMHNNDYMVDAAKRVTDGDVKDYAAGATYTCQEADVS